jgi:hypothetical protein
VLFVVTNLQVFLKEGIVDANFLLVRGSQEYAHKNKDKKSELIDGWNVPTSLPP